MLFLRFQVFITDVCLLSVACLVCLGLKMVDSREFCPASCGFCRMGRPQQKTPFGRALSFLTKWFPPLSRGWHCPHGVLLARRRIRHPCSGRWSSGCFGFTWGLVEFRKMLWGLPPIHFGKEDGVERTLLRVACQSETFLASPWQGGAILHASVAHSLPK